MIFITLQYELHTSFVPNSYEHLMIGISYYAREYAEHFLVKKSKMAQRFVEESVLIENFLEEASTASLNLLKEVGIGTVELITIGKTEFFAALAKIATYSDIIQLWNWVENWRQRNQLENVSAINVDPTFPNSVTQSVAAHIHDNVTDSNQTAYSFKQDVSSVTDIGTQSETGTRIVAPEDTHCATAQKIFKKEVLEHSNLREPTTCKQPTLSLPNDQVFNAETKVQANGSTLSQTAESHEDTEEECEQFEHKNHNLTNNAGPHPLSFLTPDALEKLLVQTVYGKQLLQHAKTHTLSVSGRKFVVDTVARHHLSYNRKASAEVIREYSVVITALFQKESKDIYFIPRRSGNPGGKLYSRINYIKQSERKRDREEVENVSTGLNVNVLPIVVENALSWLELNNFPWTSVLTQWEISFPGRKQSLRKFCKSSKLIASYPHLSEAYGYQLLDIDYRLLCLGDPSEGCKCWTDLFKPIAKYVAKHARDPSSKDLIYSLENEELSTNSRLLCFLLALNTVLVPVKAAQGFKPTVATAQSDTFLLVVSREKALEEIQKSLLVYEEQRVPIPPKLVVLGENLSSVTGECLVLYKNIEYKLTSIARGNDVLVKLLIVLGLPASKLSKLVWLFIIKYVYRVEPDNGGYLCLSKLIEFLNNQP
ncbi:uncharacterized protein LOC131677843 [Topomyia yanbarensis]|uniref:uncharacterized protein LOC131677843 n=1 Tax=Topomyia yanbarensis TaxID=2498891 RepID=UPI00273C8BB1|nr:uncharacterized protein LOC131677843 [Topomyia yanbarensis]